MPLLIGTHSGSFHADDVLAVAMLREFIDPTAQVVRSRDPDLLDRCDVVVDVGGRFDPASRRFDHHQADYDGPLSSAGMVLQWLEREGHVDGELASQLRGQLVNYVDDVDNGRRTPEGDVPCFASLVGALNSDRPDGASFDERFADAADIARQYVHGIRCGLDNARRARRAVRAAMDAAVAAGRRTLLLDEYVPWKGAYYDHGGAEHPTDFVLFPAEGSWRIYAIPPEPGSFAQKRPLPAAWAGLTDGELERASGIRGAIFCHKNRFIAVFATRDGALQALRQEFGDEYVTGA